MFKIKTDNYFLAVGKNNFYIRYPDGKEDTIFLENVKLNPNVPFFHYIADPNTVKKEIKVKATLFNRKNFYVLIQDDSSEADKKIFFEYCRAIGAMQVSLISQNAIFIHEEIYDYIAISKTIRCIVISYLGKHGKKEIYLDKDATIDEIIKKVNIIKSDIGEDLQVYINNIDNDMDEFKEIGKLVSKDKMFDNAIKIIKDIENNKMKRR